MKTTFQINGREIASGCPVYILAELSANHNQDFDQAVKILEAAKQAGADAVKLQTYTPDTLTIDCNNEYFKIRTQSGPVKTCMRFTAKLIPRGNGSRSLKRWPINWD